LGNGADDIGSKCPERTAALDIKQKKKFVMSVVTYRQDWQGELKVAITQVPSIRTTTVSSMSQLRTIRQNCHGELNVTVTHIIRQNCHDALTVTVSI
jgi:hypothetical protein